MYNKKFIKDDKLAAELDEKRFQYSKNTFDSNHTLLESNKGTGIHAC
jgi:hypothetical protein